MSEQMNLCKDRHGEYIKIPLYWFEMFMDEPVELVGRLFKYIFDYARYDKEPDALIGQEARYWYIIKRDLDAQSINHKAYRYRKRYENQTERFTKEYCLWRESVYRRDDYTCQICGERGGKLNAHHIKPFAYFPELRTSIENGITLCTRCHRAVHRHEIEIGD